MTKLFYKGHPVGSAAPLPEGWPAADHEEEDHELFAAKVDSGLYAVAVFVEPVEALVAEDANPVKEASNGDSDSAL